MTIITAENEMGVDIVIENPAVRQVRSQYGTEFGSRTRRFHNKSRHGCEACKKRRIKCNEERPSCGRCQYKLLSCHYVESGGLRKASNEHPQLSPRSLKKPSLKGDISSLSGNTLLHQTSDDTTIWLHFWNSTDSNWLGSPSMQRIMQLKAIGLVWEAPYLVHAMLAISASHLSFKVANGQEFEMVASTHYQYALHGYRARLSELNKAADVESIFAAALLIAMLGFVHSMQIPWEEGQLLWIESFQGARVISASNDLGPVLRKSMWDPIVQDRCESDGQTTPIPCSPPSNGQIQPDILVQLDEIDAIITNSNRQDLLPEFGRLRSLAQMPSNAHSIGAFIAFITGLPQSIIQAAKLREPYSLLLIGTWCILFGCIGQWWIAGPARCEVERIFLELDSQSEVRMGQALRTLQGLDVGTEK